MYLYLYVSVNVCRQAVSPIGGERTRRRLPADDAVAERRLPENGHSGGGEGQPEEDAAEVGEVVAEVGGRGKEWGECLADWRKMSILQE